MRHEEGLRIAFRALWSSKLRTFLTVLGNIVGVTSVIAVVSLIGGVNLYVREEIAEEGSNVVTLMQRNQFEALSNTKRFLESLRNPRLTLADYREIDERLGDRHRVAARTSASATVAVRGERYENVSIHGWTANVGEVRNLDLAFGRLFTRTEVDGAQPVCVLGADVVDRLFGQRPAEGARVKVGGRHLRVIGGIAEKAGLPGQSPNRQVIIPITVFAKIFGPRGSIAIPVQAAGVEVADEVEEAVRAIMRVRHRLRPDEPDDFAILGSETLIDLWTSISRSIFSALVFLVSISLVVGGIVIMNTMLVSVSERTREIGIRKAIGARHRDIVWQFLLEAVTLSVLGGVIGILLGFAVAALVARVSPLPYAIELWSIAAGVGVTAAVGVFFGLYPARRAAALPVVEALRRE
jgi:putative ABC transport system permease protein